MEVLQGKTVFVPVEFFDLVARERRRTRRVRMCFLLFGLEGSPLSIVGSSRLSACRHLCDLKGCFDSRRRLEGLDMLLYHCYVDMGSARIEVRLL